MKSGSVDVVVSSCTLCTVQNVSKALEEVRRVLRPGGRLLFWEHVLSETDTTLAQRQIEATPEEVRRWGCHLDRRTLEDIKAADFAALRGIRTDSSDEERFYVELPCVDLMGPTAVGIAIR